MTTTPIQQPSPATQTLMRYLTGQGAWLITEAEVLANDPTGFRSRLTDRDAAFRSALGYLLGRHATSLAESTLFQADMKYVTQSVRGN